MKLVLLLFFLISCSAKPQSPYSYAISTATEEDDWSDFKDEEETAVLSGDSGDGVNGGGVSNGATNHNTGSTGGTKTVYISNPRCNSNQKKRCAKRPSKTKYNTIEKKCKCVNKASSCKTEWKRGKCYKNCSGK